MSADPEAIERDLAASRARLDGTLDRLQARLNPGGIVEDMLGTARRSEAGSAFYDGALHAVRHNPLSVLLIAAGAALFLRQVAKPTSRTYRAERDPDVVRVPAAVDPSPGDATMRALDPVVQTPVRQAVQALPGELEQRLEKADLKPTEY